MVEEPVPEALVPVVVDSLVVAVAAVAAVPVVPVEVLVSVEVPVEQTTALGISVTPPRAQIDLATLRVAVE